MILNPYRYGGAALPDYSGYGITRHFGLQKIAQDNVAQDYFIQIKSLSTSAYYVFKDVDGVFSLSSKTSTTTTPSSGTVADLIAANPGTAFFVENYYCNITGLALAREGSAAEVLIIDTSGNILNEGGFAAINFNGGKSLSAAAISELNNGNDFSISSISANRVSNSVASLFSTINSGGASRIQIYVDRRTEKRGAVITSSPYFIDMLAQLDSGALRRLYLTVNGTTKEAKLYLNGTHQNTITFVGTYTNDIFRFGAFTLNTQQLTGPLLDFKASNQIWSAGDVTSLDAKHVTQFGL